MVLSPLDPNGDPKPRRDDERFGGDYKAFRKAAKAWSERDSSRRKRLKAAGAAAVARGEAAAGDELAVGQALDRQADGGLCPKPRGRVPLGADGGRCSWDGLRVCWRDAVGCEHSVYAARDARE